MASLEQRADRFRVVFRYGGKKYSYSLKTKSRREAEGLAGGVEKILLRLEQNLLRLPEGMDIVSFVKCDGKPDERPAPPKAPLTLQQLHDKYLATHSQGALEANSLATVAMHLRHFLASLGPGFPLPTLTPTHLQEHIGRRAKKKGFHKRPLSAVTMRKEMASFRAAWNWAAQIGLLSGAFPGRGLKYPKTSEKPPFQTYEEVERHVSRGGLTMAEGRALWDALFLTLPELEELLAFVQVHALQPFVYPMFCFAAHTGARRSELLRLRQGDIDLEFGTVLIHEKKRARGIRTTRRVPLSPFLAGVLKDWLATGHPGGQYVFCQPPQVIRSKKRRCDPEPVTRDEANDHFKRTLAGSKWARLRGWHVLRHSFASNCAAKGVDQRIIDEWMGHQTEEMRRRYRHLFPSQQRQAIQSVFGDGK